MQVWKRLDQGFPGADWRSVMKDLQLNVLGPMTKYTVPVPHALCVVHVYVISFLVGASSNW